MCKATTLRQALKDFRQLDDDSITGMFHHYGEVTRFQGRTQDDAFYRIFGSFLIQYSSDCELAQYFNGGKL